MFLKRACLLLLTVSAVVSGSASGVRASLLRAMSLGELTNAADRIVVGTVSSVHAAWDLQHRKIISTIEVDIEESWKGPANALAVTTVFKSKTTGEIVDADMEINAVSFAWADLVADPAQASSGAVDFQNTVTHKLGHVIGLAHNCYSTSDGPAPLVDNTGNPEPGCGSADTPASVADATMYPVVALSDTDRRTLSPDDVQAACDIYPGQVAFLGGAGCAVAGPASAHGGWAVGLACFLVLAFAAMACRRSRPPA